MKGSVSLRKIENIFYTIAFLIGVAVCYGSSQASFFLDSGPVDAREFGMAVSGLLAAVCAVKLILNIIQGIKHTETKKAEFNEIWRLVICAAAMIAYTYGISNVGYLTCTALFAFIMLMVLSEQRTVKRVIIYIIGTIAFCALLYFLFRLMKVYMPNTPLI